MAGRFFVMVALVTAWGVALSPAPSRAAAGSGPPSSVQTLNQIVVVPPLFGVDGDYPSHCVYVGAGCVATLFAGGIIVSMNWPPINAPSSCQNCAASVISYAVYRVPPGATIGSVAAQPVFHAPIQNAPNPTPTPLPGARHITLATPTPPPHITMQMPPQEVPSLAGHVQVASGSWHATGIFPQTFAIIPNVKVGDCFVARVIAPGNWQSADSNEVCISSSTKFGTETVDFAPANSYGFYFARNLLPAGCYQTYLQYSQPNAAGPVGWQPYSITVPPSSVACVGTQVLYSAFDFDLGTTQFPIEKAELVAGGAACVSELDIGPTNTGGGGLLGGFYKTWVKHTMAAQASLDQDVTSMLTPPSMASQSQFAFVFAASLVPPPATVPGHCVSTLSGVTLKVTRLRQ